MTADGTGEWQALAGLPPVAAERTWRYGPDPAQVVDYYGDLPGRPRVTVLHGGYWRERFDRTHLTPTAGALAGAGFAVALAEYRRGRDSWPRMAADVARVVSGCWPGDGAGQLLVGHSAGGQLALWAAQTLPERVRAVIAVGPVADLARARELGLSDHAVDELFGAGTELAEADPVCLVPPARPVTVLHGAADTAVPPELSRRYAAVSGADLREPAGTGHFAPLTPGTAAFGVLLDCLRAAV